MPGEIEYEAEATTSAEAPPQEQAAQPAPGPNKCPYCDMTYAKIEDLNNHLLIWHGISQAPPQGGQPVGTGGVKQSDIVVEEMVMLPIPSNITWKDTAKFNWDSEEISD